jgi:hypothetical protein
VLVSTAEKTEPSGKNFVAEDPQAAEAKCLRVLQNPRKGT